MTQKPMKLSDVDQFAKLKRQLTEEQESIVDRLTAINFVLNSEAPSTAPENKASGPTKSVKGSRRRRKAALPQSILSAMASGEPMSVNDIGSAVGKKRLPVNQALLVLKKEMRSSALDGASTN